MLIIYHKYTIQTLRTVTHFHLSEMFNILLYELLLINFAFFKVNASNQQTSKVSILSVQQ